MSTDDIFHSLQRADNHKLNPASWAYERLCKQIIKFEKNLDDDTEIGARLVSFTEKETFHIEDLGYHGPDFIIFYGTNADNKEVQLIQHISQISVLLVALPKISDKPRRIGFILERQISDDDSE